MISLSSRSLLLTLFVSIPSQADISISGSAKVNVTNAESISTSSVSISGATVVTTNTTSIGAFYCLISAVSSAILVIILERHSYVS
jgi:hypothetical protein